MRMVLAPATVEVNVPVVVPENTSGRGGLVDAE
jgi:hypothetical protein